MKPKNTNRLIFPALILAGSLAAPFAQAASQTWDGGGANGNWSTLLNWLGDLAAPGDISGTTNTDVATFNAAIAGGWGTVGTPILIDSATQNIGGISFGGATGNYFIGTIGGNSLLLSSGGTIQILNTLTATNAVQTINAPLIIQGGGGTYAFANNSANGSGAGAGTLNIGGGITGGAAGATVLTLNGSNTNANTISGIIGNGSATTLGITKDGAGTWILTGANTYTGGTTLTAGTLSLGSTTALGATASTLVINGGTLDSRVANLVLANNNAQTWNNDFAFTGTQNLNLGTGAVSLGSTAGSRTVTVNANTLTVGGIISDGTATGLTKAGSGTLTLTGVNAYTGTTTVKGGTLTLNRATGSLITSGLTFGGTGTFNMDNTGASGALAQTLGALTFSSGDGTVQTTRTAAQTVGLTFNSMAPRTAGATRNFVLGGTPGVNGTDSSITLTGQVAGFIDQGSFFGGSSYAYMDAANTYVRGAVYGTDAGFSANQTGTAAVLSAAASTHALYTGAAGTTTNTNAASTNTTLTFASTANFAVGQAISGANIRAGTYITALTGTTLTISQNANSVASGATITPYPGITAQTSVSYNTLNLAGPGASLSIVGGNTVTLTNGGILRSAGGSISGVINGGTITAGAAEMVIRTDTAADILNIASVISGSGGLTKSGAGSLVLNGLNNYTGATTIAGGTAYLLNKSDSNHNYFGNTAGIVTLAGGSTLNAIGYGGPTVTVTNPLVLAGGNATFIANNGTYFPGTTAANNGFEGADFVINGQISGSGGMIVTNTSGRRLELKNAAGNTFTGGVTVTGAPSVRLMIYAPTSLGTGPLRVEATGTGWQLESAANLSLGTGVANPVTINSGSTLSVSTPGSSPLQLSGVISGSGALNKRDADVLTLTGVNSYTGGTTVTGGVLTVSGSGTFGSSAGNMTASGGILDLAGNSMSAGTVTISGGIIQNGTLTGTSYAGSKGFVTAILAGGALTMNSGGNRLVLSGANTYGGGTTITAGTLRATSASALPSYDTGTVTVAANGTLQVTTAGWSETEIANLLSNSNLNYSALGGVFAIDTSVGNFSNSTAITKTNLGLTKLGANTLTLTGASTYQGKTIIDRGTLKVDASTTGALSTSSALTFSGTGAFNYDNGSAAAARAQSLGALTFSAGEGTVQVTRTTAQNVGLTFSSLPARTAGATRNFVLGGTNPGTNNGTEHSINLTGQALGFIDQGSFFGGSSYAYMNAAGTYVRGGVYGTDANFVTSGTTGSLASATHQQITGAITAQNTASFTTLNISGNNNLTLAAAQTVSVSGILKSGNTAGGAIITGGTGIQALTSGGEMVVRTDGVDDALTISTPILANGASSLTKSGAGALTLSVANTITGGVNLNAGTLNINNAQALGGPSSGGNSASRFTINEGTTIDTTAGALALTLKYPMTWNGSFTFTGTNDLTFFDTSGNGNITMPNDLTITVAAKTLKIPNNFAATSATLTKNGPGTLFFGTNGGANYSGGLVINAGAFVGGSASNSLATDGLAGTGPITLGATSGSDTAILGTGRDVTHSNPITVRAGSSNAILALTSYNGTGTWAGPVTLNNNLTVGGAGGVVLPGVISGSGKLLIGNAATYMITGVSTALTNTATVVLFGDNTFTGDTVMVSNSGALQLSGLNAVKNSTLDTGTSGSQQVTFGVSGNNTYNLGGLKGADALNINANTISVGANGQSTAYTGVLSNTTGSGSLTKTGSGKLTLSGANTYSGATTLSAGTLQFAKIASLYNSAPASWTAANIRVASGATLALNVGVATEFSTGDVTTLLSNLGGLGGAPGSGLGLQAGSKIAFDTTNASPSTFTVADNIANSTGTGGGAIGVTKLGTNTLVLSGTNTYTGATTVSVGTLKLASTASLGNTAMTVASGATLSVQPGSGNINLTGSLTLGSGSLFTLSGDNGIGTFTLGGSGNGLTLGGATVPAFTFDIGNAATGTDRIIVTNNVSAPSGGSITINQLAGLTSLTAGNYNLITSAGGFIGGGANGFTLTSSTITVASVLYNLSLANSTSSNQILTVSESVAPTAFWAGSVNDTWSQNNLGVTNWRTTAAGNVDTGVVPGSATNVSFVTTTPVAGNLTTVLGADITINSLIFTAAATTPVTIGGGNTLTLNAAAGAGITVISGSAAHTISSNLALGASQTWTVDSAAANPLTVSGAVTGSFALTKAGTGTLTLSGANTYTGVTTANAGTLQLAKTAALYNGTTASWTAANINVKSGATLGLNVGGTNEFTTGDVTTLLTNLAASSSATNGMNAGSVLGFDTTNASGDNFTIADVIADTTGASGGGRGLTKLGTKMLTLTGTNTYTGATTISAGTLQLGSGGTTGSLSGSTTVTNNGNLTINRSNAVVQGTHFGAAAITGTGSLTQAGTGTTTLSAANYAGVTTVSAGTLQFAKTAGLYNGTTASWTADNLNVASGATLAFNVGGTGEFSTGDVTTLLTNLAASSSPTNGMNAGAILGFDTTNASGGNFTIANVIANTTGDSGGVRVLNKLGSGTLTLSNTNTYTGGTLVSAGTLSTSINTAFGSGAITLANGTTFQVTGGGDNFISNAFTLTSGSATVPVNFGGGADVTLTGLISGAGGLVVTNDGSGRRLTLPNANTFTGGVILSTGAPRLLIGNVAALGTGTLRSELTGSNGGLENTADLSAGAGVTNAIDLATGKRLNVGQNSTANMKLSGIISGAGSLAYGGAGTLTLSGANTYTGTTTIGAGKVSVATIGNGGVSGNLGSATSAAANLVFDGGTLQYTGATASTDRNFTINTGKTATVEVTTNDLTISGSSTATNGALTKTGAGTLQLTATNTYTGITSINAGKLVMGDAAADTFATSAVNVAATATLLGSGTIAGNVTLAAETSSGAKDGGTLAPGNSPGTLIVGGTTTLNEGSIFSWDISSNGASFDKLQTATLADGGSAGGSVFQIVVADPTFTDTFWDTAQSWTNLFTTDGTAGTAFTDWANIFSSTVSVVNGSFATITPVDGSFTLTGSTLSWSAVPEPSTALGGLLLAAGLLRRRRSA